jgi:hypothetical protein
VDRFIYGQRALSDGTVHHPSADKRVFKDPEGHPPSQDQCAPAIAYIPNAGHYDPETDDGIWGRFRVPTERALLPLVL